MSARSYQAEVVRLRQQMRAAEDKAKALAARLTEAEKRLTSATTERDQLRLERYGTERDAARLREVLADPAELELHRLDAWRDHGLEEGEDPPAAGWPEQVADPELYVATSLGLVRERFVPKAPPPPPQKETSAQPSTLERHLAPERAELHRALLNGGAK